MVTRRTVVLMGDSLLIAGVEASLRDEPEMDVMRMRIDAILPDVAQRLSVLSPDVVIFNLVAPGSPFSDLHFSATILQEHPGMALIGLDPNSNTALVLSGQERTVLAADDLAQVIQALGE